MSKEFEGKGMVALDSVTTESEVEILPDAWSPDMMPDPGLLGFSY